MGRSCALAAIVGNLFGISDPPHFGGWYKQQSYLYYRSGRKTYCIIICCPFWGLVQSAKSLILQ